MNIYVGCVSLALLVSFVLLTEGARRIDVKKRMTDVLHKFKRRSTGDSTPTAEEVMGLEEGEKLVRADQEVTGKGTTKTKYQETFNGIKILGESVVMETDASGQFTGEVTGSLVEGLQDDLPSTDPDISVWDALQIAIKHQQDDPNEVIFNAEEDAELEVVTEGATLDDLKPHLVYKLSYLTTTANKVSRPFYIIDSTDGTVLAFWQGLDLYGSRKRGSKQQKHKKAPTIDDKGICGLYYAEGVGGNEKIGQYTYGEERALLPVTKYGDRCLLENKHVAVFHSNYSWNRHDRDVHEFECELGNMDSVNGAYSPLNDVFFGSNLVTDMYHAWFGISPLNDKIYAFVHFGENFENAFWDGNSITFGDGNETFYPFTTIDVVSHEVGHGFTEQHSSLMYIGQSGGINEAFSDISGEAAESFLHESDWYSGFGFTKDEDAAMRYFKDPTKDGMSIGHADDYCPGIDVHHSSGVFNKAFYLLSHKPGWTVRTAFEIFVKANRLYWGPRSTYAAAACGVVQACEDMGYTKNDVEESFREVGIEPCVESHKGVNIMDELKGDAGEDIIFTWNAPERLDYAKIETYENAWFNKSELSLQVMSDAYTFSSNENGSHQIIEIFDPVPGKHQVSIHGESAFSKVSLYVLSTNQTIAQNVTGDSEVIVDVCQEIVRAAIPVAVRIKSGWAVGRYGLPPDLQNYKLDFFSQGIGHDDEQILICKPKAGKYYLTVFPFYDSIPEIILYTVNVLHRVADE